MTPRRLRLPSAGTRASGWTRRPQALAHGTAPCCSRRDCRTARRGRFPRDRRGRPRPATLLAAGASAHNCPCEDSGLAQGCSRSSLSSAGAHVMGHAVIWLSGRRISLARDRGGKCACWSCSSPATHCTAASSSVRDARRFGWWRNVLTLPPFGRGAPSLESPMSLRGAVAAVVGGRQGLNDGEVDVPLGCGVKPRRAGDESPGAPVRLVAGGENGDQVRRLRTAALGSGRARRRSAGSRRGPGPSVSGPVATGSLVSCGGSGSAGEELN